MQTARVAVHDASGKRHIVRILFDTGSHRSYITEALSRKLSLPIVRSEVIKVGTFGGNNVRPQSYNVVDIQCSHVANNFMHAISTIVVPQITCPVFRAPLTKDTPVFKQLVLADPPSVNGQWLNIDILVGLDYYWQLVQDQVLRLPEHGLTAVSSVFGWLVSGSSCCKMETHGDTTSLITIACPPSEDRLLTRFWDSETFDRPSPIEEERDQGDVVLERFEDTIQYKDRRFEVGLPWKVQACDLPTNEKLCRNRFNGLVRRLKREDVIQQYSDVIDQQARLHFIEKVQDPTMSSGPVHYIPHHPVIKKDHATTKLRIVYDASAQQSAEDPSLNDSLYSGPNMVSSLITLLLLFRSYVIVLLAHIEKAFLQVGLIQQDRDATRFLWLKDINKPPTDDNIEVWRFRRVPFGATSSPFLLAATLRHHLMSSTEPVATKLMAQFYVDNLVVGVETTMEAIRLYHDPKLLMSKAGMNLREWKSNISQVMEAIPTHDQAKGDEIKVLGLPWPVSDDVISIKSVGQMNGAIKPTKRQILQTIAKIFDPMGLVSPVVIAAKIFIQTLWKQNIGWDDHPSDTLIDQWRHLNHQLATVHTVAIPRRLLINESTQLHVFTDASNKAYGAVVYVRTFHEGAHYSQLAFCKSRVVPIKPSSTPRLELLAALLGCKVAAFFIQCFPVIKSVQVWSDSQVVLHWIQNGSARQGVFVANRVRQIQGYQYPFRYCNTSENPADFPSRGRDTSDLSNSSLWWSGPHWLTEPEDNWPKSNVSGLQTYKDPESKESESIVTVINTVSIQLPPFGIKVENYSSLGRLLRVTAFCSRFISRSRRIPTVTGPIVSEELTQARTLWIRHVQCLHFQQQFVSLEANKHDRLVRQFGLIVDDSLLKCHGRFQHSNISCNDVILLPRNDHFTSLVVTQYHHKLYHQGVRHTLAKVRKTYWIPQGRQKVRSVLGRCVVCKRWQGAAYSLPKPAALPIERLTQGPPFCFTGCDFAGPLYVFNNTEPRKVYICLFTCAVTRALHLELVSDMTTPCFILALKRFISRRGSPAVIISDNAKTFKLAQLTLNRVWHDVVISSDTVNYIAAKGIEWKFNIERAPWWEGFFERMVGLVKRAIVKAVGRAKVSYDGMVTVLTEIEAILNTRPLTYVHDDLTSGQPLTPANFLSPASNFGLPTPDAIMDPDFMDEHRSATMLTRRFRQQQVLLDRFWNVWLTEYLSGVREHHHQARQSRQNPYTPHIGDVVLVKEDGIKRANWKIAVIIYLFVNKDDGHVRAVRLRCNEKEIQRPISRLYPLEVQASSPVENAITSTQHSRPTRKAAIKASQNIRAILHTEDNDI